MRYQPNRDYISNDDVQTPLELAQRLVLHFKPTGRILEPCRGDGNFLRALRDFPRRHPHSRVTDLYGANAQLLRRSGLSSLVSRPWSPRAQRVDWCEIKRGRDFFAWQEDVDWIITNPPWSQIRPFLQHAMRVAENVVFLLTINHVWTKARIRDINTAGFGLREMVMVDMPRTFPQSGFQLGAVHVQRGWTGPIALTDWTGTETGFARGPMDQGQETRDLELKSQTQTPKLQSATHSASRPRPRQFSTSHNSKVRTPNSKLQPAGSRLATAWIPELLRKYNALRA